MRENTIPMSNTLKLLGLTVFSVSFSSALHAEVLELVGGGKVSGRLQNSTDESVYKIKTYDGIELEIPKNKVTSKPQQKGGGIEEREKAYLKMVAKSPDTEEGNTAVANYFFDHEGKEYARAHWERIVELNPADEQTWVKLEYVRDKYGEWIRRDRMQMSLGLVKELKSRKWTTPHARAIAEVQQKQKEAKAKIDTEINTAFGNLTKGEPQATKARAFFQELANPIAIPKIKKLLDANDEHANMLMEVLERMPNNSATDVFIDIAMNSPNQALVTRAIQALQRNEQSYDAAMYAFVSELTPKATPERIERAGGNLQSFPDQRAIVPLINSLLTKVTQTRVVPGTSSFGKGADGGVSQSSGGTFTQEFVHKNGRVLSALIEATQQNFQYDQQKWTEWYAREYAKTNLNLRRDE